jgi:hypothetical protein
VNNLRRDSRSRLDLVHRVGAVLFGLGLGTFGVLGLVERLDWFSTSGAPVLGLSTNGLLSAVSLVVAVVLVAGGVRGGRTASSVLTVVGAAFLLSGVLNVLLLEGPYNILAFRMPNVVFSLVSGGLLLVLGSYGRFTGRLPDDNPYAGERGTVDADGSPDPVRFAAAADARAAAELAAAERAAVQRTASPAQLAALEVVRRVRRAEDRVAAWQQTYRPLS